MVAFKDSFSSFNGLNISTLKRLTPIGMRHVRQVTLSRGDGLSYEGERLSLVSRPRGRNRKKLVTESDTSVAVLDSSEGSTKAPTPLFNNSPMQTPKPAKSDGLISGNQGFGHGRTSSDRGTLAPLSRTFASQHTQSHGASWKGVFQNATFEVHVNLTANFKQTDFMLRRGTHGSVLRGPEQAGRSLRAN